MSHGRHLQQIEHGDEAHDPSDQENEDNNMGSIGRHHNDIMSENIDLRY